MKCEFVLLLVCVCVRVSLLCAYVSACVCCVCVCMLCVRSHIHAIPLHFPRALIYSSWVSCADSLFLIADDELHALLLSSGVAEHTIGVLKAAPAGPVRKNAATVLARMAKHAPVCRSWRQLAV